jgi:hypothetical protein
MTAVYGAHDLAIGERDAVKCTNPNVAAAVRYGKAASDACVTEQTASPFRAKVVSTQGHGTTWAVPLAIMLGVHK